MLSLTVCLIHPYFFYSSSFTFYCFGLPAAPGCSTVSPFVCIPLRRALRFASAPPHITTMTTLYNKHFRLQSFTFPCFSFMPSMAHHLIKFALLKHFASLPYKVVFSQQTSKCSNQDNDVYAHLPLDPPIPPQPPVPLSSRFL